MGGMRRFSLKTEIVFGPSPWERLNAFAGRRVGLVTDQTMLRSGAVARMLRQLSDCDVRVFNEVEPEPPVSLIVKGVMFLAAFDPEVVVALGGGSPIDAAKAIVLALREMKPGAAATLVAVPTTSGTGSEATSYAVVTDLDKGIKHPLRSERIVPDVAILDPDLVRTAPPHVTADAGMDVIAHALEALVSREASDFSDALAEKALSLAFAHLPRAFDDGGDGTARTALHNASCMAGMAFNAAGLGLNHGMAHALGGRVHVSHGCLNAMLLPLVIAFNAEVPGAAARYAAVAARLGDGESREDGVRDLVRRIAQLNRRFGIPTTLRALGEEKARECERFSPAIVAAALADSCTAANPRRVGPEDVGRLVRRLTG